MRRDIREFVMVERQQLRRRAEAAIETLLAILDEIEGDTDLEDFDEELDDDGDLAEPSLGWGGHGSGWVAGRDAADWHSFEDMEDEHDGAEPDDGDAEPDADSEPVLGWSDGESLVGVFSIAPDECEGDDEREFDFGENGLGDGEGAAEQGFVGFGACEAVE